MQHSNPVWCPSSSRPPAVNVTLHLLVPLALAKARTIPMTASFLPHSWNHPDTVPVKISAQLLGSRLMLLAVHSGCISCKDSGLNQAKRLAVVPRALIGSPNRQPQYFSMQPSRNSLGLASDLATSMQYLQRILRLASRQLLNDTSFRMQVQLPAA